MSSKTKRGNFAGKGKDTNIKVTAAEDEILSKLAEKELEAAESKDKLLRILAVKEVLDAEKHNLSTEVEKQKCNLKDINEYLTSEVRSKSTRVIYLEQQLADLMKRLEITEQQHEDGINVAVQEYKNNLAAKNVELLAAQERLQAYDTFLAEKDSLAAQILALDEEINNLKKTHHKRLMDLERKHAQDRELWKKDTVEAVKNAREEMMSLTDNRLEITTKRTILENEQMSGELQYQSRQVQLVVRENETLKRELLELKTSLNVANKAVELHLKKLHICERTTEALLIRLEEQDAMRLCDSCNAAEYQQRIADLEEEIHSMVLQLNQKEQEQNK